MKLCTQLLVFIFGVIGFDASAQKVLAFDYFGVGVQHNSYNSIDFAPQFNTTVLAPSLFSKDDSGLGLRGFVGHHFNQYIALEGGFTLFGKAKFKVSDSAIDATGKTVKKTLHQGEFSTYGADARAVATYPLSSKMFVKAHAGALLWHNKFSILTGTPQQIEVNTTKDTGVSLVVGVGLGYGFNKKVALSLDFEKSKVAGLSTQSLGLSVLVRF
jgi:hypothetical protein